MPTVPPADHRPTVLYVEDHPVNAIIMDALLKHRPNLRLVLATTGEEGLQAAQVEQPDLLLIDYELPDCNGVELLAQLRRVDGLAQVPAVAVSASDAEERLAGSSFHAFWPKPLDVHATLRAIDRLMDDPPPVTAYRSSTVAHPSLQSLEPT